MERHLAAILAADVVGYSRLMEQDEAGTFERLRAHRKELFEPEIARRRGRIFKLMGDGLLAEFLSVVDAVECAVALQTALATRNAGLGDSQRIDMRMGINLGDVIVEGEDRHGEGVNIAARLQALAEPGGITASRTVAEHVKHRLGVRFETLGTRQLKNIAEPVAVYRVQADSVAEHGYELPIETFRLSPFDPEAFFTMSALGWTYLMAGRFDEAIKWTSSALRARPAFAPALRFHAACLVELGRLGEARDTVARLLQLEPGLTTSNLRRRAPIYDVKLMDTFLNGLRKAGLPE